jgi:peptidoglycan/LPS O-acetylase OafA/YrhL
VKVFDQSLAERLTETQNRPSGFDYLRIILALGIILSHAGLISYGGWDIGLLGRLVLMIVPMFFALSGFLVAGSLERSKTLITFLGLRVFRIVPALSMEVFLSALILGPLFTTDNLINYFTDRQFCLYFLNVIGEIHYQLPGVFRSNPNSLVNGQLWTVPWELVSYLALAALAFVGVFHRRHLLLMCLIGLYVVQIGNSIVRPKVDLANAGGATLVVCFVAGLVIYRYRDKIPWSCLLCFIMAASSLWLTTVVSGMRFAPIPMAYVTIYLGLLNPRRNKLILSGDYSYGLYLYGFPIQQAIFAINPALREWYWNLLLAIPCAGIVAVGSWWLVEKPVLERRHKLKLLEEWYLKKYSSLRLSAPRAAISRSDVLVLNVTSWSKHGREQMMRRGRRYS